jgi:hypothetical protein
VFTIGNFILFLVRFFGRIGTVSKSQTVRDLVIRTTVEEEEKKDRDNVRGRTLFVKMVKQQRTTKTTKPMHTCGWGNDDDRQQQHHTYHAAAPSEDDIGKAEECRKQNRNDFCFGSSRFCELLLFLTNLIKKDSSQPSRYIFQGERQESHAVFAAAY